MSQSLFSTETGAQSISGPTTNLAARYRKAALGQVLFFSSTLIGILALVVLLFSIVNQSMGLAVVENKVDPATLSDRPLNELTHAELASILAGQLTQTRLNTIEREKPLAQRSTTDVRALVIERIVQPQVQATWYLTESLINRELIETTAAEEYPDGQLVFRSWFNSGFLTGGLSSRPETAGIRTALLGSLWLIAITIITAFPLGVGAALYLEEYAADNRLNRIFRANIDNLAGVPSIVYGILGLAIFVRTLNHLTSGAAFGVGDGNGRTILSAGLTMGLLVLPLLIINAQEAIRAVPGSLRQAAYGLGATRWQTIWHHVIPAALPGILTGTILAISRAVGETAPLIVVGASTFITSDPSGPFSKFTALPIQIYNWTTRPQDAFHNLAAAAILVLLIALLTLNAAAIILRNRLSRRTE